MPAGFQLCRRRLIRVCSLFCAVKNALRVSPISSSLRMVWISSERFVGSTRMKRRISRRDSAISGWSAISAKADNTSASAGTILGFFGADIFRVMVADLSMSGRKTFNSTNAASGNFVLSTCGPCSETVRPFVPLPVRRLICPVSPNSIASITPLLPEPLGPEIANVPF